MPSSIPAEEVAKMKKMHPLLGQEFQNAKPETPIP
jgi:hypothetical protein